MIDINVLSGDCVQADLNVFGEMLEVVVRGKDRHLVPSAQCAEEVVDMGPLDAFGTAERKILSSSFMVLRLNGEIIE